MLTRLGSLTLFASLLAAPFAVGCSSNSSDASLTVENEESVAITAIFVDSVGDETFSDNLLGNEPLLPGDTIQIDVVCDHYDVEIADEAGGDCTVLDVDLCFNDQDWIINDNFCAFSSRKAPPMLKIPHKQATRIISR